MIGVSYKWQMSAMVNFEGGGGVRGANVVHFRCVYGPCQLSAPDYQQSSLNRASRSLGLWRLFMSDTTTGDELLPLPGRATEVEPRGLA